MRDGETWLICRCFLAAARLQDFLDQPTVEVNFSPACLLSLPLFLHLSRALSPPPSSSLSLTSLPCHWAMDYIPISFPVLLWCQIILFYPLSVVHVCLLMSTCLSIVTIFCVFIVKVFWKSKHWLDRCTNNWIISTYVVKYSKVENICRLPWGSAGWSVQQLAHPSAHPTLCDNWPEWYEVGYGRKGILFISVFHKFTKFLWQIRQNLYDFFMCILC